MKIQSRKWELLLGVLIVCLALILSSMDNQHQAGNRTGTHPNGIDSQIEILWFNLIP